MNDLRSRIIRLVYRLPNYVKAFGIASGITLLFRLEWTKKHSSDRLNEFHINYMNRKVFLRNNIGDHSIFWQCIVTKQYDFKFLRSHFTAFRNRYENLLAQGVTPVFIDAGGNIGLASVWFAYEFPEAHIAVIEPEENNLKLLKMNTEWFSDRLSIFEGGLWKHSAALKITNPTAGSASFEVAEVEAGPDTLRGYSFDEIRAHLAEILDRYEIMILKMDVEGSQADIFSGNPGWLDDIDLITLELEDWLYPWSASSRNFMIETSKLKFDYLIFGENIFCFNHARLAPDSSKDERST